jgi:hypothetical protein
MENTNNCCEKCNAKEKRGSALYLKCMHPHCPCHSQEGEVEWYENEYAEPITNIVSEMLDSPIGGIYPTSKAYKALNDLCVQAFHAGEAKERERVQKLVEGIEHPSEDVACDYSEHIRKDDLLASLAGKDSNENSL